MERRAREGVTSPLVGIKYNLLVLLLTLVLVVLLHANKVSLWSLAQPLATEQNAWYFRFMSFMPS